jgi:hypothetical protein
MLTTSRSTRQVALSLLFACAAAAVAVPASAAVTTRVAFVQGIPGTSVDVCIGSKEVRSGLRYGGWFQRGLASGTKAIRFRQAAPGTCTGSILRQTSLDLQNGDDLTVVATTKSPHKVLVFDNTGFGILTPSVNEGSFVVIRQASDLGDVSFKAQIGQALTPTADAPFAKGDEWTNGTESGPAVLLLAVTRPDKSRVIVSTAEKLGAGSKLFDRVEIYLLGTKDGNARLIAVRRDIIDL